jgi:hypothetical protein
VVRIVGLPVASSSSVVDQQTGESMSRAEFLRRKRAAGKPRRSAAEREDLKDKIVGYANRQFSRMGEVPTCREIAERFSCHWTTVAKVLREAGLARPPGRRRRRL